MIFRLVKFEWQKIRQHRMIWLLFCLVLIGGIVFSVGRMGMPWVERTNAPFEGKLTNDLISQAKEEKKRLNSAQSMTALERKKYSIYEDVLQTAELNKTQVKRIKALRSQAQASSSELKKRKLMQQASLLSKVDYQHVGNYRTLDQLLVFLGTGGYALIGVILILITSTTYSREAQMGVSQLLYSSKNGRKTLLTAKLLLSTLLITGTILLYNIIQWILFFRNPSGWELSIQNIYPDSPYPLTLGQLYLIAVLMQWLVSLSLIVTFTFLSLLVRHVLVVILLSSVWLLGPFFIESLFFGPMVGENILSLLYLTQGQSLMIFVLFRDYATISIFGYPIILPILVVAFSVGVILLFGWGCYRLVSRQSA
ncbi:ABC transporter permease subunit [Exiguobacterium sp. R-39]|uniref:ABC transporter permease subunit n=1 Tax=Exiguobacterium sp. R-39 TaxID=3416708 RepID=UPI003CF0B897